MKITASGVFAKLTGKFVTERTAFLSAAATDALPVDSWCLFRRWNSLNRWTIRRFAVQAEPSPDVLM